MTTIWVKLDGYNMVSASRDVTVQPATVNGVLPPACLNQSAK
jgi:hypothetical protein